MPKFFAFSRLGGCGRKVGRLGVRIGVRMFSMEDRRRAVDLYFTEGMTIRKVIAELGYPSEGALVKWVREDPRYTGACRRSYTLECKTNAARRALEGEPLARVARDAGCTPTSVYFRVGRQLHNALMRSSDTGRTDARGRR